MSEAETKLKGILDYFGIADGKNVRLYRVTNADVELLRKAGVNADDIRHCLAVAGKALEIACRTGTELDLELIGRGALFHDLGKSKTHAIEHGKLGAEMGKSHRSSHRNHRHHGKAHPRRTDRGRGQRNSGCPSRTTGLTASEEKIVIYADRLVDIITDGVVNTEEEAEQRFEEILKNNIKYGKNDITLKRYLDYHREIQAMMGNP